MQTYFPHPGSSARPGLSNFCPNLFLLSCLLLAVFTGLSPAYSQDYGTTLPESVETDIEYGTIRYASTPRTDPIALLRDRKDLNLKFNPANGYLNSLLEALRIDPTSQILVFSRTSLNIAIITPETPRAIYFNDTTYLAWTLGSDVIEIASMDPKLGPVFYNLAQNQQTIKFDQQTAQCLRCHDSYSLTGGGVPRFILGSGYTGANGNLVSHEGWILTDPATPLQFRWGGWYVTGKHGNQVHLGNIVVNDPAELQQLESMRNGNLDTLETLLNTSPYLARSSDIVALMVIEHQVYVQNLITRVGYDIRTALQNNPEFQDEVLNGNNEKIDIPDPVNQLIRNISEPLVRAMLMANEAPLTDTIAGSSGYAEWFESQGPYDNQKRSLRELDLQTRLFRYPLSYLIYSAAFDQLPILAKQHIYRRLAEILHSQDQAEEFQYLSGDDKTAILEILNETSPEFTAAIK